MQLFSKVVGSTFCDGQKYIRELDEGSNLFLVKEPDNEYDKTAIAVYTPKLVNGIVVISDKKLGYLPRQTANSIYEYINSINYTCIISEITGRDKDNVGCNLSITINR